MLEKDPFRWLIKIALSPKNLINANDFRVPLVGVEKNFLTPLQSNSDHFHLESVFLKVWEHHPFTRRSLCMSSGRNEEDTILSHFREKFIKKITTLW